MKSKFRYLTNLPPTADALKFHGCRAYYQIQTWLGNHKQACDWGWKLENEMFLSVMMSAEPALDNY